MPTGPGKYDDACTAARLATDATAVVLIVLEGQHGSGLSVQSMDADITQRLPRLLRVVADEMERSAGRPAQSGAAARG